MDNLNTHHCEIISQVIHDAGHRIAFRAPYYPVDGPIEYLFNTLQAALTLNMYNIYNNDDMLRSLFAILAAIQSFEQYFLHCLYTNHN